MKNDFWKFWRLQTNELGRQNWIFDSSEFGEDWSSDSAKIMLRDMQQSFKFDKTKNVNSADKVYRAQKINESKEVVIDLNETEKAINFYCQLQAESGHWPGDYGGPNFLTPGLVIASYTTETPLPEPQKALIKQYMLNHQNTDGGWGLHIEDKSTMFGTVLQYVALRLLGMAAEEPEIVQAKTWIIANGGATFIPSWGKFYLAVLGVYEWEGCNSLFPEMWLLPKWLPFHPSRYWCHARMVYLPMAYCYGEKVTGKETPLITAIRSEIYTEKYAEIDWKSARNKCAAPDLYHTASPLLSILNLFSNTYEKFRIQGIRKRASAFLLNYINAEDEQTNYINIGPVNKVINSIAVHYAYGKNSIPFKKHVARWSDYLWLAEDGIKMNGYNGSQLWDTAFAAQSLLENWNTEKPNATLEKSLQNAYRFLDTSQVKEEVEQSAKFYRHKSVGGWPFSTVEHGWPITDCTAEGLKTVLELHALKGLPISTKISDKRIQQAADLLLSFQNKNGGWASYELTRAPNWIEQLNPSELFGNIMIDYSYVECSSACLQSLVKFSVQYPTYKTLEINKAIQNGLKFILSIQRADGSWYGSWAVCFTYGTWFGIEALVAISTTKYGSSEVTNALEKACKFLLNKQNTDGGWGEDFKSCLVKEYIPSEKSQVVNTAWAMLGLMAAKNDAKLALQKGFELLKASQLPTGDFPQQNISGVFNHSCGITYTAYRNVFPIWAMGRYNKMFDSI